MSVILDGGGGRWRFGGVVDDGNGEWWMLKMTFGGLRDRMEMANDMDTRSWDLENLG